MNLPAAPGEPAGTLTDPALLSALTTEHYTLQAARSSTVVEANGRSSLFLSATSGAVVALALVAQLDRLGQTFTVFVLTVLPTLLVLGLTTYSRLADLAVQDAHYARGIGRIRAFYLSIEPSARQYWLQPAGDDAHALMRQAGQPHSRWHHLGHTATAVAAVTAAVAGAFVAVVGGVLTDGDVRWLAALGSAVAFASLAGLLADQERRWRRADAAVTTRFLPDGQPVPAGRTPVAHEPAEALEPRAAVPALAGLSL
jgi:hypothetical protein